MTDSHEPAHLPLEVHDPDAPDETTRVPLKIEDWLTVVTMGLLALITFANVLVRYFTDQSFAWTEELSVFLMIVLSLVAGSASVARNRQIRIEYFADSGSPARQRRLAQFGALMVFLLFTLIAVLSARVVWDDVRFGETSPGIGVPQWWYTVWLPLLSVAIAGRALGLFVRRSRQTETQAAPVTERTSLPPAPKLNARQVDNLARVLGTLAASSIVGLAVSVSRPETVTRYEQYGLITAALSAIAGMLFILRDTK